MTRRQALQALAAAAIAVAVPQRGAEAAEATTAEDVQVCRHSHAVTIPVSLLLHDHRSPCPCVLQFKTLSYPTLAFEFQYPVSTASGRKLPVIISRKPERYSSAAPMTADARQRIVTELVDFPDGITISVSVSCFAANSL